MGKAAKQDLDKVAQGLERAGRIAEAGRAWAAAVKAAPKDPRARLGLVRFHNRHNGDPARALPHALELKKLAPKAPATYQELAETLCRLERFGDARTYVGKGLKLAPKSADLLYVAATVENRAGRYAAAGSYIEQAETARPGHWPTQILKANILIAAGQMEAARAFCLQLLENRPGSLDVISAYHRTGKMTSDDPVIADLRDRVRPGLPGGARAQRAMVETMLGKVANDEGRHEEAFDFYTQAKALNPAPYDLGAYRAYVTALERGIKRPSYLGRTGHDSDAPVLIVGMPRSGSTLLEQILASHPNVVSAGESPALRNVAFNLGLPVHNGPAMVAAVKGLSDRDAATAGAAYLAGLDPEEDGTRIVDKRLHNFELLGLFARLFPNGRVLHTMRDPLDNCVSIYMQNFRKTHAYAWKQEDLGRYYLEYRRLMAHWKRELPLPFLDVVYEQTVADTEATARRVVEFAGLDWDDACLSFQNTENRSRTLSQWQVRQPVYTTSVQRWRRYDSRIGPLKAALAGLYPAGSLD